MHWEYWPTKVVYFFPSIYFLYLCLKSRSLLFFTASNPSIETGGMFFESKWQIFELLPKHLYPITIFVNDAEVIDSVLERMEQALLHFPLIAKPDRGERGWGVKILHSRADLELYMKMNRIAFLLQAYVDYPEEVSIFYFRPPNEKHGRITSLTRKELLSVTGDGKSTLHSLILNNDRAFLHIESLKVAFEFELDIILPEGESKLLVPYGNHCRGTMFIDACAEISPALTKTIDEIARSIDDFYFGRFDIRTSSICDLSNGLNFLILELNGAGSEPAHIYHPGYDFVKGQITIVRHFKMMYQASKTNHAKGVDYLSFKEFWQLWSEQKAYRSRVKLL